MCGIAGIVSLKGRELARDILDRMVRSLSHRGPDCNGTYHGGTIGLAHARLSIIDLSGGHQPMSNEDGSLWITFNGEVFNYVELRNELIRKGHRFLTHSDTEVILHMYEEKAEECVQHFNGQWAFAIWDAKRHRLFLSRDRIGVLPLFYTLTPDSFLFASEIDVQRYKGIASGAFHGCRRWAGANVAVLECGLFLCRLRHEGGRLRRTADGVAERRGTDTTEVRRSSGELSERWTGLLRYHRPSQPIFRRPPEDIFGYF